MSRAGEQAIAPGGAESARGRFILSTYAHLGAALVALVLYDMALFESGVAYRLARAMSSVPWILILGAFMVVGWLTSRVAWRVESEAAQYAALTAYVVAKGTILVPLLVRAEQAAPGAISSAARLTLAGAAALTAIAAVTRSDFRGLRPFLYWGGFIALVLIVVALFSDLRLGVWFSVGMLALAGASILYDTAKVLRRARGRRPVAAALALFADIALMFWYVLRLTGRSGGFRAF